VLWPFLPAFAGSMLLWSAAHGVQSGTVSPAHGMGLAQRELYATCLFEAGRDSAACEAFKRVCTRKV
jgi:hypothetical protein